MKLVRRALVATLWVALLVTTAACAKAKREQSPAARLVQRELRQEFNTRYLHVWEKSRDTLQIEITGRLARGTSGKVLLARVPQGTLARRAIELLAPDSLRSSLAVTTVVVDVTSTSRFGPIAYDSRTERVTYRVDSMFQARTPANWMAKARANALHLQILGDSVSR